MASNDRKRQQNTVDYETGLAQNNLNNLRDQLLPVTQLMANNYTRGSENAFSDYGDIMGEYKKTLGSIDAMGPQNAQAMIVNYARSPELQKTLSGYGEFADTGGFSSEAIRDLRARGVSPIRAAYGNAQNDMERRINLQGGYSPNAGALRAKMAREQGQLSADAMQNVNANLAQMVQSGRLSGLSGLSQASQADIGFGQNAQMANQSAGLRASEINASPFSQANQRLNALGGMASLYSATPGQASTFGNQVLNSQQNQLGVENQQQGISGMKIGGQQTVANMPTGFQAGLANAQKIGGIASNIAGIWNPGSGSTSMLPSARVPGAGGTFSQFPNIRTMNG